MHCSHFFLWIAAALVVLQLTSALPANQNLSSGQLQMTPRSTAGLSSSSSLSTSASQSTTPYTNQNTNNTAVKAGNYNILFCGNLTTTVRESLQLLWSNLGTIKTDAETGTSSPAYQAFFKDNDYTSFVEQMLTNITNGASLQKAGQNSAEAPTLACLTGPGIATEETSAGERDLYEICSGNSKYAAFYRSSTNWIFICPAFFSYQQQTITTSSPASQYCPNVVDNYFVQDYWMHLVQSQIYLLMHEILHFYLDSAPYPSHDSSDEVTDINVAFNVAAGDAISNPESYVIYAAMVSGGCTNYPASTDTDPDECDGTCLSKLGSPASDVISISNLTVYGMDVDAMSMNAINKTISGLSTSSLISSGSNEAA